MVVHNQGRLHQADLILEPASLFGKRESVADFLEGIRMAGLGKQFAGPFLVLRGQFAGVYFTLLPGFVSSELQHARGKCAQGGRTSLQDRGERRREHAEKTQPARHGRGQERFLGSPRDTVFRGLSRAVQILQSGRSQRPHSQAHGTGHGGSDKRESIFQQELSGVESRFSQGVAGAARVQFDQVSFLRLGCGFRSVGRRDCGSCTAGKYFWADTSHCNSLH